MSDKFRRTFPIRITMAEGEMPSAQKFNALATQARNGLNLIERGIGDPWGLSGDPFLVDYPLQLVNLARVIGQNQYLNPAIYPTTETIKYVDDLSIAYSGLSVGYLQFVPDVVPNGLGMIESDPGGMFDTNVTNEIDVLASGQYWIDQTTGKFRVYSGIVANTVIKYDVTPLNSWMRFKEVLPGVIPDPGQTNFTGVRFSTDGSDYFIHLPPREYLDPTDARYMPGNWPTADQVAWNLATTTGAPYRLFQETTTGLALAEAHYRYSLAPELTSGWSTINVGDMLPMGFLYLWDQNQKSAVTDCTFYKTADSWILKIQAPSMAATLSGLATGTDETAASYQSGYSVITPGASLAASVWNLQMQFLKHKHNNTAFDPLVNHDDLVGLDPPTSQYAGHSTTYPTYLPNWFTSNWSHDNHTSLLSRAGSQTTAGRERDPYNNAMLGHLLMANADTSGADNYIDGNMPNNSFGIYFGDVDGPHIHGLAGSGLWLSAGDSTLNLWEYPYLFLTNAMVILRSPNDMTLQTQDDCSMIIGDQLSIEATSIEVYSYSGTNITDEGDLSITVSSLILDTDHITLPTNTYVNLPTLTVFSGQQMFFWVDTQSEAIVNSDGLLAHTFENINTITETHWYGASQADNYFDVTYTGIALNNHVLQDLTGISDFPIGTYRLFQDPNQSGGGIIVPLHSLKNGYQVQSIAAGISHPDADNQDFVMQIYKQEHSTGTQTLIAGQTVAFPATGVHVSGFSYNFLADPDSYSYYLTIYSDTALASRFHSAKIVLTGKRLFPCNVTG
jgi:hypothetical protein